MENLKEIDKFLEIFHLPKLNQEKKLNKVIMSNEIESLIQKLPRNKSPGQDGFTGEFYQISKELKPVFSKNSKK